MIESDIKRIVQEILEEMNNDFTTKQLHNTTLLLNNYNRLKAHVEDVKGDITPIEDLIKEYEYECSEDEVLISSMLRTKMRTAKMLAYIDECIVKLKQEAITNNEYYKYKAFYRYYIDRYTNEQIAGELKCTMKMPRVWRKIMIERLSVLLWGVSALKI